MVLSMFALLLLATSVLASGNYSLRGPSGASVSVSTDSDGIVTIDASLDTDLFFAQGYVFASQRWWQLEVGRRIVSGTLSEVLGQGALQDDVFFRSLRLLEVAKANYAVLQPRTQAAIQAAVDGINTFFASLDQSSKYPAEYDVYNIPHTPPANWTTADAIASGVKILAYGLGNGQDVQTATGQLLAKGVSADTILASLQPRPFEPSVIGGLNSSHAPPHPMRNAVHAKLSRGTLDGLQQMASRGKKLHFPRASNNWVVAGKYTDTGKPILCNDPHLHFQTPSLWMLMRLNSPQYSAVGAALPLGLPGIVIGANADIAWGYTNVMSLEEQLFVMQTRKQDDSVQYFHNGVWKDFDVLQEQFNVSGVVKTVTVFYSVYGPVAEVGDGTFISLYWTGLSLQDTSPDAAIGVGYASNHDEWLDAMSYWVSANQNAIFADGSDIAYHTVGLLHERLPGDSGQLPLPGDGTMDFFDRAIKFEDLPQLLNPERGYIFSANNRILAVGQTEYTVFPQFDGLITGFRAQRIGELLQAQIDAQVPITVDYMASIQGDQTTLMKSWLSPSIALIDASQLSPDASSRLSSMQAWDGKLDLASDNGPVFEVFWLCLKNATYFKLGNGGVFWLDIEFMQQYLLADNCDNDWSVSCATYITQCFQRASDEVPQGTSWGDVHSAYFGHVTPVGPLSKIFDRSLAIGGSPHTPFAADGGRVATAGPSYRQIVSMGNRSASRWIMPMGNSGDPTSPFYDNLLNMWATVQYLPM